MTKQALLDEHKKVKESWHTLEQVNLHSFDVALTNLYLNVLSEYEGEKEDSEFYHARKLLTSISTFSEVAEKRKKAEFSEIRSVVGTVLRDFELLIHKIK